MNALNLTLERQNMDSPKEVAELHVALLHQAKISNFDPQILAKWAICMINDITFFLMSEENESRRP